MVSYHFYKLFSQRGYSTMPFPMDTIIMMDYTAELRFKAARKTKKECIVAAERGRTRRMQAGQAQGGALDPLK